MTTQLWIKEPLKDEQISLLKQILIYSPTIENAKISIATTITHISDFKIHKQILDDELGKDLYQKTVILVKKEPTQWHYLIQFYPERFRQFQKRNGKINDSKVVDYIRTIAGRKNVSKDAVQQALTRYKREKGLIHI